MTKEGSVGVTCAGCGVEIVVMSADLLESWGDLYGVEGEMRLREHVAKNKAEVASLPLGARVGWNDWEQAAQYLAMVILGGLLRVPLRLARTARHSRGRG